MTNQETQQFDDSQFDESQFEEVEGSGGSGGGNSGGSSNRVFLIGVGILGALTLLAIVGGILFYIVSRSGAAPSRSQEATQAALENQSTARAATATVAEYLRALTPTVTLTPLPTVPATPTPVLAIPTSTATPAPTLLTAPGTPYANITPGIGGPVVDAVTARTQTVAAMLTQASGGPTTATPYGEYPYQPTELPETGFADEVGLPMLAGLAVLMVFVIIFVRRMRMAS